MSPAEVAPVQAATEFLRTLASCLQVASLYPPEHPEYRDRATRAAVAGRTLLAQAQGFPLFLLRRGCYLGPTLLPRASLMHEALLEASTEAGLVAIEISGPPDTDDVQLLTDVVRGAAPVATPIRAFRLNQVMPAVHGVDTSGLGNDASGQLATVFMRSTFEAIGAGHGIDAGAVRTVAERLHGETVADPAMAVLLAAVGGGRDEHLAEKSVKVARLVPLLVRLLRWSVAPQEELVLAGLLHDVGMATVERETRRSSGPLSPAVREKLEAHPIEGAGLLLEAGLPGTVVEAALHHHRGHDGGGYPAHPSPSPPIGRVVAVADRYAALTTRRPYRAASTPLEALQRVQSATDLDPEVVSHLARLLGAYPPGSLVRLDSGEVALVLAANRRLPTQPKVRVLLDAEGRNAPAETRDLSEWGTVGFRWDVEEVVDPATLDLDLDLLLRRGEIAMAAPARAEGSPPARPT